MSTEAKLLRAYNQRDDATFERCLEHVRAMQTELHQWRQGDPMGDLIQANRDQLLRMHEEAVRRVRRCLKRTLDCSPSEAWDRITGALAVLDALNLFHPMHGESWKGWPEGTEP